MSVQPLDGARFCGQMRRSSFDDLAAIDIACHGARVRRSREHIARTTAAVFVVDFQLAGESIVRQSGREARLRPGDFVLTDSTRCHEVVFETEVSMRLLRVPATLLKRFLGCPEDVVGLRIDGSTGTGRIASQFVRSLWHADDAIEPCGRSHIARAALELISGAYAPLLAIGAPHTSLAAVHHLRLVEYIERHLHEVDLSPATIATALRISRRYLHRLFEGSSETLGQYLLRKRLERCAALLLNRSHARWHVGDIAFACGFNTVSHFCRTFRARYGVSPGEFRERAADCDT